MPNALAVEWIQSQSAEVEPINVDQTPAALIDSRTSLGVGSRARCATASDHRRSLPA